MLKKREKIDNFNDPDALGYTRKEIISHGDF